MWFVEDATNVGTFCASVVTDVSHRIHKIIEVFRRVHRIELQMADQQMGIMEKCKEILEDQEIREIGIPLTE